MREIKFRAWITYGYTEEDLKNSDMAEEIKETGLGFMDTPDLIDLNNERIKYDCDWYDSDRFILMQSTGLKDKNSKEIYEGDIVKAWSEGKSAVGKVMQRIDGLWLLYPAWQGKEFWGLCPNNKGNTTVEVIGNIYENPELLN